jgi:hypothetical protein
MNVDDCVAHLMEQVDEIIAQKVAEAVDLSRALGGTPEEIEAMLDWHIPEMARERQRALAQVRAALARDFATLNYSAPGSHTDLRSTLAARDERNGPGRINVAKRN